MDLVDAIQPDERAVLVARHDRGGGSGPRVVSPSVDPHSGSPRKIATGESPRIRIAATSNVPASEAAAVTEAAATAGQSTSRPVPAGPPAGDVTDGSVTASKPSPTPSPTVAEHRTTAPYSNASVDTTFPSFAPSASKDAASYSYRRPPKYADRTSASIASATPAMAAANSMPIARFS